MIGVAIITSILLLIFVLNEKLLKQQDYNYKNKVLTEVNNPDRGIIISDKGHFKIKIEKDKYYMKTNCDGCGADEILKNGICAYCKNTRI